ncbi:hypothetical protein QL285_086631 [Trifolium repens]|nr:hypothetical protein QL285_086631 [Trifolium repens]
MGIGRSCKKNILKPPDKKPCHQKHFIPLPTTRKLLETFKPSNESLSCINHVALLYQQNYTLHPSITTFHAFKSCILHASHQHHIASIRAHPNKSVMHHASYLCFKVSKSSNKSFLSPKAQYSLASSKIHFH